MPPMLLSCLEPGAWESFTSRANQDLDIVNNVRPGMQFMKCAACAFSIVLFSVAVATVEVIFQQEETGEATAAVWLFPAAVPTLLMYFFIYLFRRFLAKNRECVEALRKTCNDVSQQIPGLTFHLEQPNNKYPSIYHITVNVSGELVDADGLPPSVTFTSGGISAPAQFCPSCGAPSGSNRFCSQCGKDLTT